MYYLNVIKCIFMNTSPNISSFKSKFLPMASEELAELQKFAISEGFTGVLELWDIPYWKRKHKEHLYRYVASCVTGELYPFRGMSQAMHYSIC